MCAAYYIKNEFTSSKKSIPCELYLSLQDLQMQGLHVCSQAKQAKQEVAG